MLSILTLDEDSSEEDEDLEFEKKLKMPCLLCLIEKIYFCTRN